MEERYTSPLNRGVPPARALTARCPEEKIATSAGRARLALCAFQVPIGDQMRSMCEVNALGIRDNFYSLLEARRPRSLGREKIDA